MEIESLTFSRPVTLLPLFAKQLERSHYPTSNSPRQISANDQLQSYLLPLRRSLRLHVGTVGVI